MAQAKGAEMTKSQAEKRARDNEESDGDIHVMPNNGKHKDHRRCFCEPVLNYQDELTGKRVWVHKSEEELFQ